MDESGVTSCARPDTNGRRPPAGRAPPGRVELLVECWRWPCEPCLSRRPDHTAAWLTFIGALAVALIAAGTAQWRLRTQLRHDRGLSDLQDLREVLQHYLKSVNQACELLQDMAGLIVLRQKHPRRRRQIDREEDDKLTIAIANLDEVNEARAGLGIRLRSDDDIRRATNQIAELLSEAGKAQGRHDPDAVRQALDQITPVIQECFNAAQRRVGSEPS